MNSKAVACSTKFINNFNINILTMHRIVIHVSWFHGTLTDILHCDHVKRKFFNVHSCKPSWLLFIFYFAWYLFLDLTLWILSCLTPCVEAYKSKWFTRILSKQSICDVTHRGMRAYRWKYFSAVRIHIRCETGFQIQCVSLELTLITPWHNCLQNKRRVMSYETWVMSINQGSYQHFFYLLLKVTLQWI